MATLPQQGGTEGVDGGDLCLIDQSGLSAEMAVIGVLGQALGQFLGDAPPQLSRCRLGVGDDQKLGDVQPFAGHPVQQPLHQHPGLTRTGRCRHQQLPAPVVYDLPLFFGQGKGHGGTPPSSKLTKSIQMCPQ